MAKIETLLREIANEYAASLGELDVKVSEKHFKKGSAYGEAEVSGARPFKKVRDAAIDLGTVLKEDEGLGLVAVMAKGGAGSMAPVILIVLVQGEKVTMGAYSKEGLIPQYAARGIIKAFKGSLS